MSGLIRALSPTEISRCDDADNFLQSAFWGGFKAHFGWNARAFILEWNDGTRTPLLVIRRRLPLGFSMAYIPWGPILPPHLPCSKEQCTAILGEIASALSDQLPPDTAFLRLDIPWYTAGPDSTPPSLQKPFLKSSVSIQPPDSVLLDLRAEPEALLAAMKSKWRYNIRLAEKRGVSVRRVDAEGIDTFYQLYEQTATRDKIAIHSKEYYQTLFRQAKERGSDKLDLRLYVAEHEGTALAAIITVFWGVSAIYLYGASSDQKRHLMPAYALQWRAIQDARAAGCETYDFFGIPPREDDQHPMAGLYRFKTGFGGSVIHRGGAWDYPYKRLVTILFRTAEAFRKGLHDARKKLKGEKGAEY